MGGKSTKRELTRRKPEMTPMVRASKGDETAKKMTDDAITEEGIHGNPAGQLHQMMISKFTVGMKVYVETPNWIFVGEIIEVGLDYILLGTCSRVITDGRHHIFMRTGRADSMEVEPTGGPAQEHHIPIDWIGPWCEWPHELPTEAIS